jgi:hypothetical protein
MVTYVIGMGRSGTSLLMSLLGMHPELHTTPENYFSVFFANAFLHKTYFSPKDIALIHRFNLAFESLQPYVGFRYLLREDSPILKEGFKGTYYELCKEIYRHFEHVTLPKGQTKMIIDKNPANTLFTDKILEINPLAKFIFVTRDYRANALSRKESADIQSPNVLVSAIRWDYFTFKAQQLLYKYPEKCIILRYEDLVENTEIQLQRIFKFLNVSNDFSKEAWHKEQSAYREFTFNPVLKNSPRAQKKYNDLSRPIFKERMEKWRVHLTPAEIEKIESLCGARGEAFGYYRVVNARFFRMIWKDLSLEIKRIPIHLQLFKDRLFYYFPIEFKVRRFEMYVEKINQKRQR